MGRINRPQFDIGERVCSHTRRIVAKVKNAGAVGMGGACFPTHVKLLLLRAARRNV